MKKTIGNTSVNFADLFTKEELVAARKRANSNKRDKFAWIFDIMILNNSNDIIYIEFGSEATIDNGFPILKGSTIGYNDFELNELNLISTGTSEIRVLLN